jgi:PAS domain-containing protein
MTSCENLIRRLPESLREGLESLALNEGTSLDDLVVLALAEKLARTEHSAWRAGRSSTKAATLNRENVHEERSREMPRPHLNLHQMLEDAKPEEFFEDAPVCIAVLAGPEHVFVKANQSYRELLGHRQLIGRRVVDCIPEIAGTVWMDLLDGVYRTGVPRVERGARLRLARAEGHPLEEKCVDYAYKPRREANGNISGVIALGVDTSLVQGVRLNSH